MAESDNHQKPYKPLDEELNKLLQDPDFKDRVLTAVRQLEQEKGREMARVLLWSDSIFSFGLAGQIPLGFNFFIAFIDQLGEELQNVPPELIRAFAAEMVNNVDREALKKLPRTYAPLLSALKPVVEDPAVLKSNQDKMILLLTEMIDSTDFGMVCKTITTGADQLYPLAEALAEHIISDPVAFANLLNIFPPLLNNCLKITAHTLHKIDFPPEILASAVYNFFDDLELRELGKTATNLCRLLNEIHQGSATLGGNQPRLREVLQRVADRIVSDLDHEEIAAALATLGEDLQVCFTVAAETAAAQPEHFRDLSLALLQGLKAAFSGLAKFIELPGLQDLRAELLRKGAQMIREGVLPELIKPAELAALSNALIAFYNRRPRTNNRSGGDSLTVYIENLDQEELSQALLTASGSLSAALSENPVLARSFFKAVVKITFGTLRGLLRRSPKSEKKGL